MVDLIQVDVLLKTDHVFHRVTEGQEVLRHQAWIFEVLEALHRRAWVHAVFLLLEWTPDAAPMAGNVLPPATSLEMPETREMFGDHLVIRMTLAHVNSIRENRHEVARLDLGTVHQVIDESATGMVDPRPLIWIDLPMGLEGARLERSLRTRCPHDQALHPAVIQARRFEQISHLAGLPTCRMTNCLTIPPLQVHGRSLCRSAPDFNKTDRASRALSQTNNLRIQLL